MSTANLKSGYFQMVILRIFPMILIMAGFTGRRKAELCVIRIMRSEIILPVTVIAIVRCAAITRLMTAITFHSYMGTP